MSVDGCLVAVACRAARLPRDLWQPLFCSSRTNVSDRGFDLNSCLIYTVKTAKRLCWSAGTRNRADCVDLLRARGQANAPEAMVRLKVALRFRWSADYRGAELARYRGLVVGEVC